MRNVASLTPLRADISRIVKPGSGAEDGTAAPYMGIRMKCMEAAVRDHRSGRLREAVRTYEQLLRESPNDADVLQLMGVAQGQLGNHEDAAAYLKEQADYLSKEAEKTIKRTKGQVNDVVDKVTDAATGAVKSVSSLM